ncbi:MAG: DNA repair protein RecO [Alphaproteobacteria bacterium]
MKFESDGILIRLRPFGERDCVGTIFSRGYGVVSGMVRGAATTKKNRPMVGQLGNMIWMARLDSQLGSIHWDSQMNMAVKLLCAPESLRYFNSMIDLIANLLPEREAYTSLYDYTLDILRKNILGANTYLGWEIVLLRELGYAIDLSHCSGCGAVQNLHYLSPRTCRAVCDTCAQPYLTKLYKLPITLDTTYRLLDSVCMQQGIQMPQMRKLIQNIF